MDPIAERATVNRDRPPSRGGWVEPGPPTYGARLVAVHRDPAPPLWVEAAGVLADAGRHRDALAVARTAIRAAYGLDTPETFAGEIGADRG